MIETALWIASLVPPYNVLIDLGRPVDVANTPLQSIPTSVRRVASTFQFSGRDILTRRRVTPCSELESDMGVVRTRC